MEKIAINGKKLAIPVDFVEEAIKASPISILNSCKRQL